MDKGLPVARLHNEFKKTWNKFSRNQKIGVGAGFAAALLLVVFFAAVYSEEIMFRYSITSMIEEKL